MRVEQRSIKIVAGKVRDLIVGLDKTSRGFLGGVPYTENLARELGNWELLKRGELPLRQRMNLGFCMYGENDEIIGFQEMTIMNKARPTAYEAEYLRLSDRVDYIQGRKLVVHPDYWGSGVASNLMVARLLLADYFGKDWVVDVLAKNGRVQAFLAKHGILPQFGWESQSGKQMIRCYKQFQHSTSLGWEEILAETDGLIHLR